MRPVEMLGLVDIRCVLIELATASHPITELFHLVAHHPQLVHAQNSGTPLRSERKPQFGLMRDEIFMRRSAGITESMMNFA